MDEFKGKVILITGSSSGLGAGAAVHFAGRGARLSLTGRDQDKLKRVADRCLQAGLTDKDILTTVGDLTDSEFRGQLVKSTVAKFGRLDVLVNDAGGVLSGQLSDPEMNSLRNLFDINLFAQVAMTKLALPYLAKTKGNIVNISSNLSLLPFVGLGAYCMTKTAFDMFTKVLALELASQDIRVNSVNPGACRSEVFRGLGLNKEQTERHLENIARLLPVGHVGEPEDVARAVAFLASDKNSFITGENLVVDGAGRYPGCNTKV